MMFSDFSKALRKFREDPLKEGLVASSVASLYCGIFFGSHHLDFIASAFILLFILSGIALKKLNQRVEAQGT